MIKPTVWIVSILVLIVAIMGLAIVFGANGLLAGIALCLIFAFGLDRWYRGKARQLRETLTIGESLVARGVVSESTYDQAAAILVSMGQDGYRIHVADARGSQRVRTVGAVLTSSSAGDEKMYIEVHTDQGVIHFAPLKGFLIFDQPDYAGQVLMGMLRNGMPGTG